MSVVTFPSPTSLSSKLLFGGNCACCGLVPATLIWAGSMPQGLNWLPGEKGTGCMLWVLMRCFGAKGPKRGWVDRSVEVVFLFGRNMRDCTRV